MVNERYSIAIAETLYYLKGIQQQDIDKIPKKFLNFLKANYSKNYNCNFDYTKPLKYLNISNEARGLIAMICLNYWCITDEQKEQFKKRLTENELKYQEELKEKYNPDKLFEKRQKVIESSNVEKLSIIEYEEKSFLQKLFDKIKHIFKK